MKKRKWKFRMTFFSGCALVLVLVILFSGLFNKSARVLFKKENKTTLYVSAEKGSKPVLDAKELFSDKNYPGEKFDYDEFQFDTTSCNYEKPGKYEIPVYYKDSLTNCIVQLVVKGEQDTEETKKDGEEEEKDSQGQEIAPE